MSKANTTNDTDSLESTGVFHDGEEVGLRATSKYSRAAHIPKTDENGDVVFVHGDDHTVEVDEDHEDAQPMPACGLPSGDVDSIEFGLTAIDFVAGRPGCKYCMGTNDDPSKGSAKKSFARRMRYGDDWGEE